MSKKVMLLRTLHSGEEVEVEVNRYFAPKLVKNDPEKWKFKGEIEIVEEIPEEKIVEETPTEEVATSPEASPQGEKTKIDANILESMDVADLRQMAKDLNIKFNKTDGAKVLRNKIKEA